MSAKDELQKIKKSRKSLSEQVRDLLQAGAIEIFDKYPTIKSFGWRQYTPSWCDGDPCTFHVSFDYDSLVINGKYLDSDDEWDEDEEGNEQEVSEETLDSALPEINGLLKHVDYDTFEELFGDNVTVTINREGITTDDYDCGY